MGVGHGHECDVAEDTAGSPVVVIVEVAAVELCDDAHGQLLCRIPSLAFLLRGDEVVGDVENGGVVSRMPGVHIAVVDPQVIAVEHAVHAECDALPFPCFGNGECGAVVAGECESMVVAGLAETIGFPASRHGYFAPTAVYGGNGLMEVVFGTGDNFPDNFYVPFAIQALPHRRVGHGQDAVEGILHLCLSRQGEGHQPCQ